MSEWEQLLNQFREGPNLLRQAVAGMTREQLKARPIAGKWSTLEVVCHLADFEIVYADRIKRTLAFDQPELLGLDERVMAAKLAYQDREVEEELAQIESIRRGLMRILSSLRDTEQARVGIHSEAGPLTVAQLLQRTAGHVPHHVKFIHEKRQALGLPVKS